MLLYQLSNGYMMLTRMDEISDGIPLPIPRPPDKIPLRAGARDLAQERDIAIGFHVAQVILGGEIDFPLLAGEASGMAAGWHGDPALPISAASDIIGRLGMLLLSTETLVRRDTDAA
jgi:hypothetical protein